jgi:hypothetical protein
MRPAFRIFGYSSAHDARLTPLYALTVGMRRKVMTGHEIIRERHKLSADSLFLLYGVVALVLAALFRNGLFLTMVLLPLAMYMDKVTSRGHFFIPWQR